MNRILDNREVRHPIFYRLLGPLDRAKPTEVRRECA